MVSFIGNILKKVTWLHDTKPTLRFAIKAFDENRVEQFFVTTWKLWFDQKAMVQFRGVVVTMEMGIIKKVEWEPTSCPLSSYVCVDGTYADNCGDERNSQICDRFKVCKTLHFHVDSQDLRHVDRNRWNWKISKQS